jgi:GH15 family glucan-1,4-alpha-glucosidase
MTSAIGDYAAIGDGRTCALVSTTGSIDFLCWPCFDSDACLAALLGDERHGFWQIAPNGYVEKTTRRYRGATMILETVYQTDTGRVRMTDFMPWHDGDSAVIRIVEGVEGHASMALTFRPRFGFGEVSPWMQPIKRGLLAEVGADRVMLDCPIDLTISDGTAAAAFRVGVGDRVAFVLSYSAATDPLRRRLPIDRLLETTEAAWLEWIGKFDAPCRWMGPVKRSLLTLRALVDRGSGGIVAAPTLGLPEIPGGSMNWDYRYCWLRDSTFTLTALLNAGLHAEAKSWRDWILRAVGGEPSKLQIVYRVDGGRQLREYELAHLPGYRGASPVRVGNAASAQAQLDVFGELMDSFDVLAKAGIERAPRVIEVETAIMRHLETRWDQPGADIWESRGESKLYTYSQAMTWVGIDRFVKAHDEKGQVDPPLIVRLKVLRTTIHRTVCERGYSSELGHFVQHYGDDTLDASLLLLPLAGFLPADDPRIAGTIAAIERRLMDGGLVRRKAPNPDGPNEGVFLAGSCWLADCYRLQGRDSEAVAMLERVIGVANDVGLLSEEYHVPSRTLIGNMPQAFTHLALVNTALHLSGPTIQRGGE